MFLSGVRKPLLIAVLVFAAALAACGDFSDDYNQSSKVGPDGPSIPGGYYFDLTLSPSVVQLGGDAASIIVATAHVWDANGVGVPNVTVYYGGSFEVADTGVPTDANGYSTVPVSVTGIIVESNRGYVTAKVEDISLTAAYKIIPKEGI